VEHYEIAAYGTARTHANLLGLKKVAKMLQQTLDEEAKTDKKLTQLAETIVNVDALQEAGETSDSQRPTPNSQSAFGSWELL
jgi:ferritin-like metal-binding protein YciE